MRYICSQHMREEEEFFHVSSKMDEERERHT
jgi:hypothetical protein